MFSRKLFLCVAALPLVLADVKFTSPPAGSTITGTTISMTWKESGVSPPISDLAEYQVFLCAGGNTATDYIPLATLVTTGDFSTGNSVSAAFTIGLGAPTVDAYFLKMISAADGGVVINYSGRFTLASMDGTFPAAVTDGLQTVNSTSGPPTENDIKSPQSSGSSTVSGSSTARAASSSTLSKTHSPSTSAKSTASLATESSSPESTSGSQSTTLSAGAGAGIAVGAIILLAACGSGIYYCIASRRSTASKANAMKRMLSLAGGKAQLEDTSSSALARREKDLHASVHELPVERRNHHFTSDGTAVRHELQADG